MNVDRKTISLNESGLASMIVTMVMMIVITLLVLGFAGISDRTQNSAFANQLNTEAFYAAESGVNDAIAAINQGDYLSPPGKNNCNTPDAFIPAAEYNVDPTDSISYTCLLINPTPPSLTTPPLGAGQAQVYQVQAPLSKPIGSIRITWGNADTPTIGPKCDGMSLTAGGSAWTCPAALLQIDEIPGDQTNSSSNIWSNTATTFAYPLPSGQAPPNSFNDNGISTTMCLTAPCSYVISLGTGNIATSTDNTYFLKLMPLYAGTTTLTVSAYRNNSGTGTPIDLENDQVLVDSTGNAQGQLRRIQEQLALKYQSSIPAGAVQSTDSICKQFLIVPPSGPPTPGSDAVNNTGDTSNPDCSAHGY